jgi:hypothetical protein
MHALRTSESYESPLSVYRFLNGGNLRGDLFPNHIHSTIRLRVFEEAAQEPTEPVSNKVHKLEGPGFEFVSRQSVVDVLYQEATCLVQDSLTMP